MTKTNCGWLAFLFAAMALVAGDAVLERPRRASWFSRSLRPLEILGTKGLPGYVTMVVAVMVLDVVGRVPRNDLVAILVAVVCGLAEFMAIRAARARRPPTRRGAVPMATALAPGRPPPGAAAG